VELTAQGRRVDIEREGGFGEGVACDVAASGGADVCVGHLAWVRSTWRAAVFEVCGDCPAMDMACLRDLA
jgi:hypothetical protein